jgi:hypothetical protein
VIPVVLSARHHGEIPFDQEREKEEEEEEIKGEEVGSIAAGVESIVAGVELIGAWRF